MQAQADLRVARWAVTAIFGANGLLIASLATRTPSLKQDLHLTLGQLGLLSAVLGLTAVVAMQTTGGLTARFGSGPIVRVTIPVLPILLVAIGSAPNFAVLVALHLVFGAVHGTLDVSMNAHAVAVERTWGRHIMNGCHAAWSIGAVAGALVASGAAEIGISRTGNYAAVAAVLVPLVLAAGRFLLPARTDRSAAAAPSSQVWSAWRTGWTPQLLVFGAMGASVLTIEAAATAWSGVFLRDYRQASLGLAGLGYVAFSACQTSVRLVGDRLQARTSAARLLQSGSIAAAAGLLVVVLSPWAWVSVVGFALAGMGLATSLPVLFGVVGHLGAHSSDLHGASAMVARFTTMTYTGILVAPAGIGWAAQLVGLTWTLTALVPLLLFVAVAARTAEPSVAAA
jgi:Major Facilitator Superfamily